MPKRHLLIVFHSKTGHTRALAEAACRGAAHPEVVERVEVRCLAAEAAGPDDLLWAHALLLGTPENFGYMSGALKDFFDRTFYEVEGRLAPLPYAVFICAGNDGSGALRGIARIARGYPFVEVQNAVICKGAPAGAGTAHSAAESHLAASDLQRCEDLGMAMAFGLDAGVF